MKQTNIFIKKAKNNYFLYFLFLILFSSIVIYYFFIFNNTKYFIIKSVNTEYYLIPENPGGKKIANLDKKGLHLSDSNNKNFNIVNDPILKFSIQLMSHDNYSYIQNKRNEYINQKDTIFLQNDLSIAYLSNKFGNEYLLLYKNFITRDKAMQYCNKFAYFLEDCLIVNVSKLD